MTSVCGHVYGLDFIGRYNNWDKVDPVSSNVVTVDLTHLPAKFFHMHAGIVDYFHQVPLFTIKTRFTGKPPKYRKEKINLP